MSALHAPAFVVTRVSVILCTFIIPYTQLAQDHRVLHCTPVYDTLYLIVTGAGSARRVPELVPDLVALGPRVLTIMTPHASRILSPRELSLVPGHQIVESYFDYAILPRPPRGVVLVAPCGFNSLNKLAGGIADTLALSVAAEAIGRATPVIIAISCNAPLWNHPRAKQSAATLRDWGCAVLDPVLSDEGGVTMAPNDAILATVRHVLQRHEHGDGTTHD